MNKKTLLIIVSLIVGAVSIVLKLTLASPARGAQPQAPNAWPGYWQMGPNLDATILGCHAGNGLGRFTGVYYEGTNLIYFLGGRCEDNTTTTGSVFTFDPVNKVFATTGAVMTYPVSNYTLARIENDSRGHGVGLYIIGGRLGDGTQTPAVQVYYPDDNTTLVDTANPFPDAPARAPGAVVTVDDKLYVFGGFDGAIMYATTHIYDPNAANGFRWTNTGCNLPTGRAFIASAAVGTKIYSIGGDEYIAGILVALDDTEVLDTANMADCWSDADMADLPSPNDHTQAVYVNEGYLAGGIYMVGGGWATGPFPWVFRYDVATDTWDDTFPQMIVPRRNQALVYVPSTAGKGIGTGIPGIWSFGGYDATTTMTESSEFYSYLPEPVVLIPDQIEIVGDPGTTVNDGFILQNNTGETDTFNLTVDSNVIWNYTIPDSVGPVVSPGETPFMFSVDIPADVDCLTAVFTVTATSVLSPAVSGSQAISVRVPCIITPTPTPTLTPSATSTKTPTPTKTSTKTPTKTSTKTPTVTAISGPTRLFLALILRNYPWVLFQDDFGSDLGWTVKSDPNGHAYPQDGKYLMQLNSGNNLVYSLSPVSSPLPSRVAVEVDVSRSFGNDMRYGIIFDWIDPDHFYLFLITPGSQTYYLYKYDSGYQSLDYGNSALIHPNDQNNHLTVKKDNNMILVFVNEKLISTVTGIQTDPASRIGLIITSYADALAQAAFDNFFLTGWLP